MNIITRKVEGLIKDYGKIYFQDFEENKIAKSLFEGEVTIKNLKLRPEAVNQPSLPVKIKEATIDEVTLVIPWSRLFSEAVIVKVNGARVVLQTKNLDEITLSKEEEFKNMLMELMNYTKQEYLKQMGKQSSIMDFWMVKNLIDKVIDNMQISVRNIKLVL